MKKIKLILAIFFLFCNISYSQSWDLNQISQTHDISGLYFYNSNNGYLILSDNFNSVKFMKSLNKGLNWFEVYEFQSSSINYSDKFSSITFINENTGWISYAESFDSFYNNFLIWETNNAGITWNPKCTLDFSTNIFGRILFSNSTDGIIFNDENNSIYFTSNKGTNWNLIFHESEINLVNIYQSKLNNSEFYLYGHKISNNNQVIIKYNILNHSLEYIFNGNQNMNIGMIRNLTSYIENNQEIFLFSTSNSSINSLYKFNSDFSYILISSQLPNTNVTMSNNNFGLLPGGSSFFSTSNGGISWNIEQTNLTNPYSIGQLFNNIAYVGSHLGKFYTRTLGVNLISKRDNSNFNHSINFDGNNYNTSALHYLRGGSSTLNADLVINANQNDEGIFYKWNFNKMRNPIQGADLYYFDAPGNIESNYKTKNISTDNNAISRAGLTKSFKDVNGVIHKVHSSIGGVFYSRSTNNGATFSREEVVNFHSVENTANDNFNPAITEIKSQSTGYINPNQNVLATWQRNEGNSGKIKMAYRRTIDNQNYYW